MPSFDVTIAGEINLDLILYGLPERMSTNRELLANDFCMTLGSSSGILAHNLAALGTRVGFVTRVGTDPLGELAVKRLGEPGVDLSRILRSSDPPQTGVTVLLAHGETRHILTYPGLMAELKTTDLDFSYLADSRHFHISSLYLQKGLHAGVANFCRRLKAAGLTISLDTNDDPAGVWGAPLDELLEIVDILLPNEYEALSMTSSSSIDAAAEALSRRIPLVAIKCGSSGCLVRAGAQRWMVPSQPTVPVDTIGAGDSFDAGFLRGFLEGRSPDACGRMGNVVAACSTLRSGGTEAFRDATLLHSLTNSLRSTA